ncbi:MAG: rod shape-determining protein MreC [Saccharofermentans sp.]|nr:rod shape-determining protein MreC [Saccharofermentans sp.]
MRKLLTSKWFIVVMAVLLILTAIILGMLPGSPLGKVLKPVGAIASPVQKSIKNIGNNVADFWAAINDGVAIREENAQLREEIAQLEYELTQNEEASIRYEELQDAFHIRDTFSNYEIYGASVLSREADEWFSSIRIGLGNVDGIYLASGDSYAVVDVRMNLIGRVIDINEADSEILPLLHEGFVVSAKVNAVNGAGMIVRGDASLKLEGLCLVTDIDENTVLVPGTEIVTSGDGGLFPQGIPIGVIESVDDSNPLIITATLRPYADVAGLNDVFVMVPFSVIEEQQANIDAGLPPVATSSSDEEEE